MSCVIINCDTLQFVKVAPDLKRAEYWAEILVPSHHNYHLVDVGAKKHYSAFTEFELRQMHENHTGYFLKKSLTYNELLNLVAMLPEELAVDETDLGTLKEKLGREVEPISLPKGPPVEKVKKEIASKPKAEKKPAATSENNGPTRPKAGTATGKVWDVADALYNETGEIPDRKTLIAKCEEQGVKAATVGVQFGKWKKALNI